MAFGKSVFLCHALISSPNDCMDLWYGLYGRLGIKTGLNQNQEMLRYSVDGSYLKMDKTSSNRKENKNNHRYR